MTVYVAMLRGVNVGGASAIKADALRSAFEALGLRDVRTLLASGNAVFRTSLKDRDALARRIGQELERRFDLKVEVFLRTLDEIRMLVERGPELAPRTDPSKLLVMFLATVPDARTQAALLKQHSGPEMIEIRGPEVYLYYPDGVARSKLSSAFLESRLKASGTARNWNTLRKLLDAAQELEREGERRTGRALR